MELDEVSIVIWHALETPVSVDSIVSLVRREYLISPEEASEDVNNIVSTLNEMNMILATEGN
ncbi:PqqD family protein [Glutamicibacter mishrai]|uniref:PqqD family protein n=1 Tax=Glutamicibacter mishrai TaxID=1775880 RepID=UPI0034C6954E